MNEAIYKNMFDILNAALKLSKKYLAYDLSDDKTWEEATAEVSAAVKSIDKAYTDFAADVFNAVLLELERIRKAQQ